MGFLVMMGRVLCMYMPMQPDT